jgi:hypothetical protein
MRILSEVSSDFWWDVARKCDYATFYHTPIWPQLAKRLFPSRYYDETFGAVLPSGVRVVFPIVSKRRLGPLRWLESAPIGGYGGFIADGPVSSDDAAQIYKYACSGLTASLYIVDNPLQPPLSGEVRPRFNLVVDDIAHMVPLDADFDTVFSRFSKSLRNHYRNGIKNGAHIRLATSLDDYRAFYPNYRDAIGRWGEDDSYGYQWNQFEQVYEISKIYPENVKLWLILFNDQIVGGRIVFYWGRMATGWNGTAHRDFLKYKVIPVAHTEMIRDAIIKGYSFMDFSTSGHRQQLITFKQSFNPITVPLCGWLYEHPLITSSRSIYARGRQGLASLRQTKTAPTPEPSDQSNSMPPNALEQDI